MRMIKMTEDYNQNTDFSEYEGLKGQVVVTWGHFSTLAFVRGTLEINRSNSPIQVPFIRNRGQSEAQFDLIGGKVDKMSNGFKITKGDISWSFYKN